jgi:hypothetical protein
MEKEMMTRKNLSLLRAAIKEYKKQWGIYPLSLTKSSYIEYKGKKLPPFSHYVRRIPQALLRFGVKGNRSAKVVRWFDNRGGWVYNPKNGNIRINKWAFDTKGGIYYLW